MLWYQATQHRLLVTSTSSVPMTTNFYSAPVATLEHTPLVSTAQRVTWLILGLCLLFVIGGALWLGVLYISSFAALPSQYEALARSISETQDISIVKQVCISLTEIDEAELRARRNWVIWAPTLGLSLAIIAGTLSVWLLVTLKRIEKYLDGARA